MIGRTKWKHRRSSARISARDEAGRTRAGRGHVRVARRPRRVARVHARDLRAASEPVGLAVGLRLTSLRARRPRRSHGCPRGEEGARAGRICARGHTRLPGRDGSVAASCKGRITRCDARGEGATERLQWHCGIEKYFCTKK